MTGKRHARVDEWRTANVGLDTDPWLKSYRRHVQAYGTALDTLEFYTRLFMESPVAIIVTTPNLVIADANIHAQKLLQRKLIEIRGKSFQGYVARSDRRAFPNIAATLQAGTGRVSRPLRIKAKDDTESELMMNAVTVRDANGEPLFVSLVLLERGEDITSDIL